jgi:hypothetical protein
MAMSCTLVAGLSQVDGILDRNRFSPADESRANISQASGFVEKAEQSRKGAFVTGWD